MSRTYAGVVKGGETREEQYEYVLRNPMVERNIVETVMSWLFQTKNLDRLRIISKNQNISDDNLIYLTYFFHSNDDAKGLQILLKESRYYNFNFDENEDNNIDLHQEVNKNLKNILPVPITRMITGIAFPKTQTHLHLEKLIKAVKKREEVKRVLPFNQKITQIILDYYKPKYFTCSCGSECKEIIEGGEPFTYQVIEETLGRGYPKFLVKWYEEYLCQNCMRYDFYECYCCNNMTGSQMFIPYYGSTRHPTCQMCYYYEVCRNCNTMAGANPCRYCRRDY